MRTMKRILYLPAILALAVSCSEKDKTEELPAEPGTIEVRGTLIDIRSLDEGSEFYPQNLLYTVTEEAVSCSSLPSTCCCPYFRSTSWLASKPMSRPWAWSCLSTP